MTCLPVGVAFEVSVQMIAVYDPVTGCVLTLDEHHCVFPGVMPVISIMQLSRTGIFDVYGSQTLKTVPCTGTFENKMSWWQEAVRTLGTTTQTWAPVASC
jgi:hypothetical protein